MFLSEVSNQMLELYEQNKTPASQGSDVGGRSSHVAPEKSIGANEGTVVANGHGRVEGASAVKPRRLGSGQRHHKGDGPQCSQSESNDNGSTEAKRNISEHALDDEVKEHRHPEQHPVPSMTDKVREGSDVSRFGSEQCVRGSPEREDRRSNTIIPEEQKNETVSCKSGTQALEIKESVGLLPEDCMKNIDKEKFKAALQKRKKLRSDVGWKKEVMDEDDLIERELEDGVELAVECEKVRRESMQDRLSPSDLEKQGNEYGHKNIGNGNLIERGTQDSRGLHTDDVEDGEVYMPHDADRIRSPTSNGHKRKAESPDIHVEGKHRHVRHRMYPSDNDENNNGRLDHVQKDHNMHAQENYV